MTLKIAAYINRPECILHRSFRYQLLATLTVNIILFSHGIAIGWLSPTLQKLLSADSPVGFFVGVTEASWIGSLVGLGSLVGNIIFGFILDLVGRKACIYFLAVPHTILWLLIYFAKSVEFLYVGRFLGGITGGGGYCVVAIFVSEIADPRIRGTLSSMLMLSVNCGILVGLIAGSQLQYHDIPIAVISLPIIYFIATIFLPDTPVSLLRRGHTAAAEQAFKFYKNCANNASYSELQRHNEEFEELKATVTKVQDKGGLSLQDFTTRPALKAFGISIVMLLVNQFCGVFAFVSYMSSIFERSGSAIDANSSAILTGMMQIFGAYMATLFVDRCGRKILLLSSTAGMAVSTFLFALYTYLASDNPAIAAQSWVPLVLMIFFVFIANIGIVAVTIVVLVEIFPARLRAFGTSFGMAMLSLMVFSILKIFPTYMEAFGISVTMWSCSAVSLGGFVFFFLFLEETKGKSVLD